MFVNFPDFVFFMPQVRANKKVSLSNFLIIIVSISYIRFQSLKNCHLIYLSQNQHIH